MQSSPQTTQIAKDCAKRATYAHATSEIFKRRASRLNLKLKILTFSGLVFPLCAGLVALAHYVEAFQIVEPIAFIAGAAQAILSLWSLIADWQGSAQFSFDSGAENAALATKFDKLAKQANAPPVDYQAYYDRLVEDDDRRRNLDERKEIKPEEKCRGHRAALIHYNEPCAKCNVVPTSMTPSNCAVCGKF